MLLYDLNIAQDENGAQNYTHTAISFFVYPLLLLGPIMQQHFYFSDTSCIMLTMLTMVIHFDAFTVHYHSVTGVATPWSQVSKAQCCSQESDRTACIIWLHYTSRFEGFEREATLLRPMCRSLDSRIPLALCNRRPKASKANVVNVVNDKAGGKEGFGLEH